MAPSKKRGLKEKYVVEKKYGSFYTGGNVQLNRGGDRLFCSRKADVTIIDVTTGKTLHVLKKEDDDVHTFVLVPNEKSILLACKSAFIHQFDVVEGTHIKSWRTHYSGPISCMDVHGSSNYLATGGNSSVKVFDIVNYGLTHNFTHCPGVISILKFFPDAERYQLFAVGNDYKIRAWDLLTKKCIGIMASHGSTVTSLEFTSDGSQLFSSSRDKLVIVWDLKTYSPQRKMPIFESVESVIPLAPKTAYAQIGCTEEGPYCITAGEKGVLKVWDIKSGKNVFIQTNSPLASLSPEEEGGLSITSAFYNPALNAVVVVTFDHNILFFNLEDFSLQKQMVGNWDEILAVAFVGPKDEYLAVATNSPHIKLYDVESFNVQLLTGHTSHVLALAVFPKDSCTLLSCGMDNLVLVWQLNPETGTMRNIAMATGHTASVNAVACFRTSTDYFVSGDKDKTLKMWKMKSPSKDADKVRKLAAEGTVIAHVKDINGIDVSPNDALIATASRDKTAKIWSVPDLNLKGTLEGHTRALWDVKFSPTEPLIATASQDSLVKIWALDTFSCVKNLQGHDASILHLAYFQNGLQLASSASDGIIRVYNLNHYLGEVAITLAESEARVWTMALNKSESRLVSGDADSTLIIFKDVTEEEREKALLEQQQLIQNHQEFLNLMEEKSWLKALKLAIKLNLAAKALPVITEMLRSPAWPQDIATLLKELENHEINSLIEFCVFWNRYSRHSIPAQEVVMALLDNYRYEDLLDLFPAFKKNLESLFAFSEKYSQQQTKLLESCSYITYLWKKSKSNLEI